MRMTPHNQIDGAGRQAARQGDVINAIAAMLTVVIVTKVGQRDNHVRLLCGAQFGHRLLRLRNRIAEFGIVRPAGLASFAVSEVISPTTAIFSPRRLNTAQA